MPWWVEESMGPRVGRTDFYMKSVDTFGPFNHSSVSGTCDYLGTPGVIPVPLDWCTSSVTRVEQEIPQSFCL